MSLGNKQIMADNIKRLLSAKGLNPRQLAIALDFKYTTVNDWVNAKTYPRIDKIEMLANFFNVSKSDLVENKNAETPTTSLIQSIYDQLTPPRQAKALTYLKKQLLEQKNENIVSENIISLDDYRESKTLPVIGVVTAGNGITQDDNLNMEKCFYTDEIPDDYDAIAYVVGNSMEPKIKNGDYLFIKNTPQVDYNTIGIFQVDGANYVKKLRQGYLESLNPECADIQLDESNDIRTIGEVVSIYREN
ncbi:TPA: S24 family peptidase [Streptococcus pneumoniae]|uniref:XRE family transcriptional regulator n=2 Tax=Streptococcus pneumoniae TaxID=1313 RepID=UPI0005E29A36|nr:S24 family peptidase [Streptococcus pneumoniae]CGE99643.1 bifunctional S24 family peptidase/transcriptional regulator [Streptococcus pneumoniae]CGF43077.1 bifunctional S24 family peptidase/transcriptional regulator [Streptococcus pneumoniae]CGG75221.1 bifunctional S24 family peptidase/transcriptional regulator [Streptococcus pneumoniae]CGG96912.1 bifunctional S24 family peptidase/transcriptional regulator [Streptococcus pneumoniae]CJI21816.1 bifunctional S24 family peptidase/transcriptional